MTMSYEQFVEYNFNPGFYELCYDILHYTPEEVRYQERVWQDAATKIIPDVYEGLPEILHDFVQNGGKICVSSHSMRATILRDYEAAGLPEPGAYFRLGMSGRQTQTASICLTGDNADSGSKAAGASDGR